MDVKDLFKEIEKYEGKQVTLEGWVRNNRNQSNFGFIDFTDGTYFKSVQIVYEKLINFEEIQKIHVGSSIKVKDEVISVQCAEETFAKSEKSPLKSDEMRTES